MPEQERLDLTLTMLEERLSVLEKKVQQAQATASGALGLAGVAFAYAIFRLMSG